mmetsp:Transcript_14135/g.26520  ORF Transcript_14135/g.26520 Transcript_14135/m.26520 type:complete len:108 (-) Transcript_14135:4764-5087(-)
MTTTTTNSNPYKSVSRFNPNCTTLAKAYHALYVFVPSETPPSSRAIMHFVHHASSLVLNPNTIEPSVPAVESTCIAINARYVRYPVPNGACKRVSIWRDWSRRIKRP